MSSGEKCYIPITIEKVLKQYAECEGHLERHEILWHEWNHNKRWLIQLQQLILPSFPSYSRHDVSHSQAVIHNIEMLLGEKNIWKLSATDCFAILHTVYIHDIGMCITHEDRKEILKNRKFHEYLKELEKNATSDMCYYAKVLLQECFKTNKTKSEERLQYVLDKKLEVYYAVIYLLAEFRRKEHGEVSKDRLLQWIDQPDRLGLGFSTIEVPKRLFYIIANCAATHTKWDFEEVLKLKQEDSGFVLDYVHPRFIAVLLQLGDALDMDNDRFHPLTREHLGKIPKSSEMHYEKHKAIRRLRITNEKISITADCADQEVLRIIREECDGIEEVLKNATFYWSVIKPRDSSMCLPTLDKKELLLNGKEIPSDLVTARFEISQEKAFNLLKGNSIYTEENFVFLRELLQNAVDATKLQYFRECNKKIYRNNRIQKLSKEEKVALSTNFIDIVKTLSPLQYPIDIELCIKKYKEDICEDITTEDLENPHKCLMGYECGVLVKITDYGIGISAADIKEIANVGSSYDSRKGEINKMPSWLQPTGTFGIGLQSVFLSGRILKATTHSAKGELYMIIFHPRNAGQGGYINVLPINEDENAIPFGSCFEVFVPYTKKKLHKDSPDTWDGKDPFIEDYENSRPIRHSRELIKQMALYLKDIVGEPLFPVNLYIEDPEKNDMYELYGKGFWKKMVNGNISMYYNGKEIGEEKKIDNQVSKVTWAYNLGNSENIVKADNGDIYKLDCKNAKLYIWNQECGAYACIGSQRILEIRETFNSQEDEAQENNVKIFYKGIHVTQTRFREDANLIEYIDLKHTLKKEYLKLNRKGFSDEGYEYLEWVYHQIIKTARDALEYFGKKQEGENRISYPCKILTELNKLYEDKNYTKIEEVSLSATALAYFAMVKEKEYSINDPLENSEWNEMLDNIIENFKKQDEESKKSTLYNIPFWKEDQNEISLGSQSVLIYEVISSKNKYAVVSKRESKSHSWVQYLVECKKMHGSIKSKILQLRKMTDFTERQDLIEKIDREAERLLTANYLKDSDLTFSKGGKEQAILKWIVSNIPTMAIFASKDGNVRVNILDTEISDSIYFCQNMKHLTLNRIKEMGVKAQRFSVPVWSGYEFLSLEHIRKSILFVKRGKFPKMGYGEMIFPITAEQLNQLTGEQLNQLTGVSHGILRSTIKEMYNKVFCETMKTVFDEDERFRLRFFTQLIQDCSLDIKAAQIRQYSVECMEQDKKKIDDLLQNDYKAIINLFNNNQDADQLSNENGIWKKKVVPTVNYLIKLWYKYESECRASVSKLGYSAYNDYCKVNAAYDNMIQYVTEHSKNKADEDKIKSLYQLYLYEVQNIFDNQARDEFLAELDSDENRKTIIEFLNMYNEMKKHLDN